MKDRGHGSVSRDVLLHSHGNCLYLDLPSPLFHISTVWVAELLSYWLVEEPSCRISQFLVWALIGENYGPGSKEQRFLVAEGKACVMLHHVEKNIQTRMRCTQRLRSVCIYSRNSEIPWSSTLIWHIRVNLLQLYKYVITLILTFNSWLNWGWWWQYSLTSALVSQCDGMWRFQLPLWMSVLSVISLEPTGWWWKYLNVSEWQSAVPSSDKCYASIIWLGHCLNLLSWFPHPYAQKPANSPTDVSLSVRERLAAGPTHFQWFAKGPSGLQLCSSNQSRWNGDGARPD